MENLEDKDGEWDKKKISIALFIVFSIGVAAYFFNDSFSTKILGEKTSKVISDSPSSKSPQQTFSSIIQITPANIKSAVQGKINDLKNEVSNLKVEEIASSSPQIQKIISDFNSLKDYPINQVQEICKKVCGL